MSGRVNVRTEIGKIREIEFGFGGYQEAQFGVIVEMGGKNWGAGDFFGPWANRTASSKWTIEDQTEAFGECCRRLRDLLNKSGKMYLSQLEGVPVEVTFDGNSLVEWRILDEVL